MDGDDQLHGDFGGWLRQLAAQAGYDLNTRGGLAALCKASGTDRGQTGRALRNEVRPQIASLRAWTETFQKAGVRVTLRDMLIRSGTVLPDDLPAPGEAAPTAPPDLYAVARAFGIPDERAQLFVSSVEAMAKTFADDPQTGTISGSQTGGLSAKR